MKSSSSGYKSIHIVAFALPGYCVPPGYREGRSAYTGKR